MKKWLGSNQKAIIFTFWSFFTWRVWLQVFLWLAWFVLPQKEIFVGGGRGIENFLSRPGLWAWANFYGEHYLAIAHFGYGHLQQALFPLYPTMIRIFASPFRQSLFAFLVSGLTISHLAFLVSLFIFYRLIRLDFDKKVAQTALFFLLVFPTSFFFAAVYTESLFLLLILACFYAARGGKWWLAGILGAFASATQVVGVFLLPALLCEWWEQNKSQKSKVKVQNLINIAFIFLVPVGLLFYMRHLSIHYQDPLMFLHVQPVFGAQRSADKIILLYQVFYRYFKMILTTKVDPLYFTVWLEFLTATSFLALLVFSYIKKVRPSYIVFAALAYITPTLTGTFSSMPRYVLVLFPCFMAFSLIKSKILRSALLILSLFLLFISIVFFTRGYFIA